MEENRFFVRVYGIDPWNEISKDRYLQLEESAGFRSKTPGEPACASFENGLIEGTTSWPSVWEQAKQVFVPATNVIQRRSPLWKHPSLSL